MEVLINASDLPTEGKFYESGFELLLGNHNIICGEPDVRGNELCFNVVNNVCLVIDRKISLLDDIYEFASDCFPHIGYNEIYELLRLQVEYGPMINPYILPIKPGVDLKIRIVYYVSLGIISIIFDDSEEKLVLVSKYGSCYIVRHEFSILNQDLLMALNFESWKNELMELK